MKGVMLLLIWNFICFPGEGQVFQVIAENEYASTGAYSVHFRDAFAFYANAASPGTSSCFSAGMLSEKKWLLPELAHVETAFCFPIAGGGCGIGLQYDGDKGFSEQTLDGVFAKSLGRVNLGIRLNYTRAAAEGYAAAGFGSSGIGFLYAVSGRLVTGWELGLPVSGPSGKMISEKSAQYFRMGFGYEWRPDLFISLQIIKSQSLPAHVVGSVEYKYGEQFFFSFGMSNLTASVFFKSGWRKNKLSINIYTTYEPVLGFSPGLSLLYEEKNNTE